MHFTLSVHFDRSTSDLYKVVAALMVATAHYCAYLLSFEQFESVSVIRLVSAQFGKIGVSIFFLMSGYGLMESQKVKPLTFVDFFKRRFIKVYLPVLFVSLLFELVLLFLGQVKFCNFGQLLNDIFLLGNDSVLWFVKVLLVLYLIFDIYIHLRFSKKFIKILSTIVLLVPCFFVFEPYQYLQIPMFFIGLYISNHKCSDKKLLPLLTGCIISFLFIFFLKGWNIFLYISISYFVILMLLIISSYQLVALKDFWGAKYSFDLYLVHNKIISIAKLCSFYINPLLFVLTTCLVTCGLYYTRRFLKIGF